jgi:hypothetical protein
MNSQHSQQRIDKLLASIERDLIDWIPLAIKDLKVASRAYALFIWYQDYDDDWIPHIGVGTELLLNGIATIDFEELHDKYDTIWCPQQFEVSDAPGRLILDECELVTEAVEECYPLLAEQYGLDESMATLSDEDLCANEFEALKPFRNMMHRVGHKLQSFDWSKCLKPMDDFAVVVSDFMGYALQEDLELSLELSLKNRLIERDMLASPPF